jgi:hypothetical protein
MPSKNWNTHRIVGLVVGFPTWLGILYPLSARRFLRRCSGRRDTKRHTTITKLKATMRSGFLIRVGIAVSAVGKGLREAAHYFGWFALRGLRLSFPPAGNPHLGHRFITRSRACYELGRKSHRNADFTVSLVPSRSLFPAFLSRF